MLKLNDSNFNEAITANQRIVIDFYADWCAPCRMLAPKFEMLGILVQIAKVDIMDAQETAQNYSISFLPTIIMFENGKEVKRLTGLVNNLAESLGI